MAYDEDDIDKINKKTIPPKEKAGEDRNRYRVRLALSLVLSSILLLVIVSLVASGVFAIPATVQNIGGIQLELNGQLVGNDIDLYPTATESSACEKDVVPGDDPEDPKQVSSKALPALTAEIGDAFVPAGDQLKFTKDIIVPNGKIVGIENVRLSIDNGKASKPLNAGDIALEVTNLKANKLNLTAGGGVTSSEFVFNDGFNRGPGPFGETPKQVFASSPGAAGFELSVEDDFEENVVIEDAQANVVGASFSSLSISDLNLEIKYNVDNPQGSETCPISAPLFLIDIVSTNAPVESTPGNISVDVNIQNPGSESISDNIILRFNDTGTVIDTSAQSLGPVNGENQNTFTLKGEVDRSPGRYDVLVEAQNEQDVPDKREVIIGEPPNLNISILDFTDPVIGGGQLNVNTTVENNGEVKAIQDIELFIDDQGPFDTTESYEVNGGELRRLNFTATLSDNDISTFSTDEIDVRADSSEDSAQGTFLTSPNFEVEIKSTNAPIDSEEVLEVVAEIENTGDVQDTQDIGLFIDDPDGLGTPSDQEGSVTLTPGENVTIGDGNSPYPDPLTYTTQLSDPPSVDASVVPGGAPNDADPDTQEAKVNGTGPVFAVSIENVSPSEPVDPPSSGAYGENGDTVNVTANVSNVGTAPGEEDIVLKANGNTVSTIADVNLTNIANATSLSDTYETIKFNGSKGYDVQRSDTSATSRGSITLEVESQGTKDTDERSINVSRTERFNIIGTNILNTPVEGIQEGDLGGETPTLNVNATVENTGEIAAEGTAKLFVEDGNGVNSQRDNVPVRLPPNNESTYTLKYNTSVPDAPSVSVEVDVDDSDGDLDDSVIAGTADVLAQPFYEINTVNWNAGGSVALPSTFYIGEDGSGSDTQEPFQPSVTVENTGRNSTSSFSSDEIADGQTNSLEVAVDTGTSTLDDNVDVDPIPGGQVRNNGEISIDNFVHPTDVTSSADTSVTVSSYGGTDTVDENTEIKEPSFGVEFSRNGYDDLNGRFPGCCLDGGDSQEGTAPFIVSIDEPSVPSIAHTRTVDVNVRANVDDLVTGGGQNNDFEGPIDLFNEDVTVDGGNFEQFGSADGSAYDAACSHFDSSTDSVSDFGIEFRAKIDGNTATDSKLRENNNGNDRVYYVDASDGNVLNPLDSGPC
jgi:hypothetical protein